MFLKNVSSIWAQLSYYLRRCCVEVTSVTCPVKKYVLRMRSRMLSPFHRKWQSHVTGRGPVRKWPCAWPVFPAFFSLSSSTVLTWLPDVTEGHLTPFGVPLWVRMYNRSDQRSRDPFGSVLGVFSTMSASHNHRKFPLLFSCSVYIYIYIYIYIGYVLLQFCLRPFLVVVVQNVGQ